MEWPANTESKRCATKCYWHHLRFKPGDFLNGLRNITRTSVMLTVTWPRFELAHRLNTTQYYHPLVREVRYLFLLPCPSTCAPNLSSFKSDYLFIHFSFSSPSNFTKFSTNVVHSRAFQLQLYKSHCWHNCDCDCDCFALCADATRSYTPSVIVWFNYESQKGTTRYEIAWLTPVHLQQGSSTW